MGHLAVGLAARRVSRVPMLALVLATIAPDLGDVAISIAGVHDSWYYTHTLPAAAAWAVVAGAIGVARYGRAGAILALLAATHVPLDYVTSRLGVLPSGPTIGLGLYDQPAIDLVVEAIVIAAGWAVYRASLERRNHPAVFAIFAVMLGFQTMWAAIS